MKLTEMNQQQFLIKVLVQQPREKTETQYVREYQVKWSEGEVKDLEWKLTPSIALASAFDDLDVARKIAKALQERINDYARSRNLGDGWYFFARAVRK